MTAAEVMQALPIGNGLGSLFELQTGDGSTAASVATVCDPVRMMQDEVFTAWMRADDQRRSELMSAGRQRLALSSKRRR